MKKAMVLFQRHGSAWDPAKPVREQAFWDEHARFVDALRAAYLEKKRTALKK